MSNFWDKYIKMRFRAHKNLVKILRNEGIQVGSWYDPETVEEYRINMKEVINETTRTGSLEADKSPHIMNLPNGLKIIVIFISSDLTRQKVKESTVKPHLLNFLLFTGLQGEDQLENVELVKNAKCIMISYASLSGKAHNKIVEYNMRLEYPIRHFTIEELQYDPTEHMLGPKSVIVASPDEIQTFIDKQRGLQIGRNRLVPEFEERLDSIDDLFEKEKFIRDTNEEILSKLPTMNTGDPWVKRKGFKVGDILKIERRIGQPKFTYRRVVLVERIPPKPPKTKQQTTNK